MNNFILIVCNYGRHSLNKEIFHIFAKTINMKKGISLLLIITYVFANHFWHGKHDIIFFISGGVLGPFAEIIAIHFGVWQYTNPDFLGIPMWLPLAWGFVSVMLLRIAETFVSIERK